MVFIEIKKNHRGKIFVSDEVLKKLVRSVMKDLKLEHNVKFIEVNLVQNFYLHVILTMTWPQKNFTLLNPLMLKIKQALKDVFMERIDQKIYNFVLIFAED